MDEKRYIFSQRFIASVNKSLKRLTSESIFFHSKFLILGFDSFLFLTLGGSIGKFREIVLVLTLSSKVINVSTRKDNVNGNQYRKNITKCSEELV